MPIDSGNLALKGLDDLFSTEENRQEEQREQVQQIPIDELHPFTNHPFKVLDDEAMTRTVESIAQYGVLAPLIARPRPEGGYEIISGHRRKHAAELAHLDPGSKRFHTVSHRSYSSTRFTHPRFKKHGSEPVQTNE